MKSICFITTGDLKSNASAKRALGLANPLSNLGWQVSIIMEETAENHHRCELECDDNIRIYYFPQSSIWKELTYKNQLLHKINPDIIYLCAFVARNMVGWKHRSKKLVEHSELHSEGFEDRKSIRKIWDYFKEYLSLIYADGLLNASIFLEDTYKKRAKQVLYKKNMPMLYFPYAYNSKLMQKRYDGTLEKFLPYPCKQQTIFIYLGSITQNYGVFTIVEAVKLLKEIATNFCVFLLGQGRDYEKTLALIDEYGLGKYVYLTGFVEEESIPAYFSMASAFISPMNDTIQDWARCPSKLYMYLPFKKPIITCKIGEPYHTLKEQGLYFSPGDSEGLQSQMLKVVRKEAVTLDIDSDKYTWEAKADELNVWIEKNFNTRKFVVINS